MPYLYAFSVFLSAFLLLQIQPMMGKYVLPWFGGTPTVWSTTLLFFQVLLTGGYAYSYGLAGRLHGRRQAIVHVIALAVSLVVLLVAALSWPSPLTPDASWRQAGSLLPIWGIIKLLAVSVGVPYLLLASNSTLMQAWAAREASQTSPYRLYALSNAGSLLALITYPVLFEPNLTLRVQACLWSGAYVVFAGCAAYLALRTLRGAPAAAESKPVTPPEAESRPGAGRLALWIGLAACASALLVSVTSQITQEVAVIPFLWVLPLTIYLLTFILAFAGGYAYSRRLYFIAFAILSFVSVWMLVLYPPLNIPTQLVIYALLLFVVCMICHNELYRLRPSARFLPTFYLMVAIGGAIGGIYVNLVAPWVFSTGFWELQWSLVAGGILCAILLYRESAPAPLPQRRKSKAAERAAPQRTALKPVVIGAAVLTLALSVFILLIMRAISTDTQLALRNFYGVSRIWEINTDDPKLRANQLTHGRTVHGFQFADAQLRVLPTAFYAESSGVGATLLTLPTNGPLRVGALGLGVGVIAAYGQFGDVFRFYEIDPNVIRIAQGEGGYFTFLKDSEAEIQVIPGDARVSLERELQTVGPQSFDVLVLDAFSGDSVPMHLLTREAFTVYLMHLKPAGVIAVNVSNRLFNLDREIYLLADQFKLKAALIEDRGDAIQSYDSVWMLLSRQEEFMGSPAVDQRKSARPVISPRLRLWTDDFSNLLQVLK
jgi:hypothetical protein